MNYKGHIMFGIISLIILTILDKMYFNFFFNSFGLKFWLLWSPLIIFSFLLPDMDHRMSIPRLFATVILIILIIFYSSNQFKVILFGGILLLIWILPFIHGWGHRGHMHSIIFILLISGLVFLLDPKISIVFFIGGLSHLVADSCLKLW